MATIATGVNIGRSGHAQSGILVACANINDRTTGEKDTGIDFKAGDVIMDCFVKVRTLEATAGTKTIDVGLLSSESGGDTDGFLDGVSTAAAATVRGSLDSGGQTYGVLLHEDESGGGVLTRSGHVITTATSLVYQLGSAHTEIEGEIYVVYFRPQP